MDPPFFAPQRFADPAAALARVREIHAAGLAYLREGLRRFVAGEDPGGRVRACYPFVRIETETAAPADTPAAAREIAAHRAPHAIVVSMQNGVDNAERAREAGGFDVLAAVVYVGASMGGPGHVVHAGRGDLVLGAWPGAPAAAVGTVADTFERAGVACRASDDIRAELWTKLVMNATFNAMSALAHARYGALVAAPGAVATMRSIVGECVAVARADGVRLPEADELHAAALRLGQAMAGATSSTEQDLARGRPTEIDALNGYVVRVGDAHGVPVPVNRALHALVGLAERARAGAA
jgi:2-dehydropantoate 2-reductase